MKTLIVAILLFAAQAQAQIAAVHYKMRMMKPSGTTLFEAWSSPDAAKFVVLSTDDKSMRDGVIIVAKDKGELIQMSLPGADEYVELSTTRMKELQSQRAAQRGVNLLELKNEKTREEKGKALIGIPCTHFQFLITARFTESGATHALSSLNDVWVADSIPNPSPRLNMLVNQSSTGFAALDEAMQFGKLGGFPLQRITRIEIDGQPAGQSTFVAESIEKVTVKPADLDMPGNLKKKTM